MTSKQTNEQKKVISVRSTSGVGYDFEDLVGAWLIVSMMRGRSVPALNLPGYMIKAQTGALGWELDDLLVSAKDLSGEYNLSISCKSNVQVTKNGLPTDFVRSAWKQFIKTELNPFTIGQDKFALITRGKHLKFESSWSDIKGWCDGDSEELTLSRITQSPKHLKIYNSVKNFATQNRSLTDKEAISLINHLYVIPTDFQLVPSQFESDTILYCRELLVNNSTDNAKALWAHFLDMMKEVRLRSGALDLANVIASTRDSYRLKSHPDFLESWSKIRAISDAYSTSIQNCFVNNYTLERPEASASLSEGLDKAEISIVIGESGSGKSALAKTVIEKYYSDWTSIWIGADKLRKVSQDIGEFIELAELLKHSTNNKNILVIDAVEKLEDPNVLISLISNLSINNKQLAWKILLTSQPQALEKTLARVIGDKQHSLVSISDLDESSVRGALKSVPALSWLASRKETVSVLKNLKTLAWTIEAAGTFRLESQSIDSMAKVSDKIWDYWTAKKPSLQNFLISLGEKNADFEHSFALSNFNENEALIIEQAPTQFPIFTNNYRHIEFDHDLVADLARFQKLKELAGDISTLDRLSKNPRWNKAFRLFGQFLLSETLDNECHWDKLVNELENENKKSAVDLLLEALCFDPRVEVFLEERKKFLFAENGKWLNRLLRRFLHVATTPNKVADILGQDSDLSVYLESLYRSPTYHLWPPFGYFLSRHKDTVAGFTSTSISKFCKCWLTSTPMNFSDGYPMILRKELADLALMTAVELQVGMESNVVYLGDGIEIIFESALLAANDIPKSICNWALEMAGRTPVSNKVKLKVAEIIEFKEKEKKEKIKNDPEFRANQKRLKKLEKGMPVHIPMYEDLPPWDLGPQRTVNNDFRESCLKAGGLIPIINVSPHVAGEILLALIIEANPKRQYSSSRLDRNLGLGYSRDGYPTIYWKSTFYYFLNQNHEIALNYLLKLINFCSDRWQDEIAEQYSKEASEERVFLEGYNDSGYIGDYNLFRSSQENSTSNGDLHCALDALEKWLCEQYDKGFDLTNTIDQILRDSNSVIAIGVLVNLGKYAPDLFLTHLRCLLTNEVVYWWDKARVDSIGYNFDQMSWYRSGEVIFNLAREWTLAPHRKGYLTEIIPNLIWENQKFAKFISQSTKQWELPKSIKERLESRQLIALLERKNYKAVSKINSGEPSYTINLPEKLSKDIEKFQSAGLKNNNRLLLSYRCDEWLKSGQTLGGDDAENLYSILQEEKNNQNLEEQERSSINVLAISATLSMSAMDWLNQNPEAYDEVLLALDDAITTIGQSAEAIRSERMSIGDETLKFTAYAVMGFWLDSNNLDRDWDYLLLNLLSSGNKSATSVIGWQIFKNKENLGGVFWRIVELGTLWSALSMLKPEYYIKDADTTKWDRWLKQFRLLKVSKIERNASHINIPKLWNRLDRLKRISWTKAVVKQYGSRKAYDPNRRPPPSLDTDFYDSFLNWLTLTEIHNSQDSKHLELLIGQLWHYEMEYLKASADERDEYHLPYQFGYKVIDMRATLAAYAPLEESIEIMIDAYALGPDARVIIERFTNKWFQLSTQSESAIKFFEKWRALIEWVLECDWLKAENRYYRREEVVRCALGFSCEAYLVSMPGIENKIYEFKNLFENWALKHLNRGDENISSLSYFLAHKVGSKLRLDGAIWIADCLNLKKDKPYWRAEYAGKALVEFLSTILAENLDELKSDFKARDAVVSISAHLVEERVETALALQDRINVALSK